MKKKLKTQKSKVKIKKTKKKKIAEEVKAPVLTQHFARQT